jgi:uncharacterized protein (TIGR02118 family)
MHKLIAFVRRKPGTTKQQFKDYYENYHSKLGEKFLPPLCKKYLRRYIEAVRHPMKTDQPPHPEFDCLVEFWFDSEADCRAFEASVSDPETMKYIVADEEKFVDRPNTFRFIVEDHLGWGPPEPGKALVRRD